MKEAGKIAVGFVDAAEMVGLSRRFLAYAANDPDPTRRLKTVRVASRRLIRVEDLESWFNRVVRDEPATHDEPQAA